MNDTLNQTSSGSRRIAYWLACILIPLLAGAAVLWIASGLVIPFEPDDIWTIAFGAVALTALSGAIVARLAGMAGR